jgi:O-antigen ligase
VNAVLQRQAALMLWLPLLLLPLGRMAELPFSALALLGIVLWWQHRAMLAQAAPWRLVLVLFAAYWLPAVLSAFDAVNPAKTWRTVTEAPRFVFFAACACVLLRGRATTQARLQGLVAIVVLLWALDALMQALTGHSLAGPLASDRVSGVFGAGNLKLGPALAVLSPFALIEAYTRYGLRIAALVWLLLAAALLLAGARAGWLAFALVSVVLIWGWAGSARRRVVWLSLPLLAGAALMAMAYQLHEPFRARVDRTWQLTQGDAAAVDHALAGRLPIWRTAWHMGSAQAINGVGVRGFRYAYAAHAAADDPWVDARTGLGALHPHHIVLEVFAETGLLGVIAWLCGALAAWRAYRAARREAPYAQAPALALWAMCFPLNTHLAFYSAFWGLLFWWLIALFCANLDGRCGD